jgi:tRNA-splicing endonuclease subunit Sen54
VKTPPRAGSRAASRDARARCDARVERGAKRRARAMDTAASDARQTVFKRGAKATQTPVDGALSDGQKTRRANVLAALKAHCDAVRGQKSSSMPCAIWREHLRRAEVVRHRGRHFHRFGCARGDGLWLSAEECAFLVETERLALFFSEKDERCASVRAVYCLMARMGVSWEAYLAYAHVCRLGYGCRRFGSAWTTEARASDLDMVSATEGLGSWKRTREDDSSASDGDQNAAKRRNIAPATRELTKTPRQRELKSRRWWFAAGAVEHEWIGPKINAAIEANALSPYAMPLEYDETPVRVAPTFQVYQPNRNFSKKSPDPVSFYLYVASDRPPNGRETRSLIEQANGKPVRVASCRQATVMMFTLSDA